MKLSKNNTLGLLVFLIIVAVMSLLPFEGQAQMMQQQQFGQQQGSGMHQKRFGQNRNKQGGKRGNIIEELNLTEEQKQKIHEMRKEHMSTLKSKKDGIKKSREALEQGLKANKSDTELKSLYKTYEEAKSSIEKEQFNQILSIRSILTDEQKEKFIKIGKNMFGQKNRGHRGRGNHRGGPPQQQGNMQNSMQQQQFQGPPPQMRQNFNQQNWQNEE